MKRWPTKPLGEVVAINPKLTASETPASVAEVTFVPMAAVDETGGNIARPEVRQYSQVTKGYTPFRENDVLFAKITPCMQNGKAAIARNLRGGVGFGSTEFHVLRPTPAVTPEWVFAFIRQPSFRSAAEASFTGSAGQQRVPADFLKRIPIPVPPLAEQERIVELLDEADGLRKLRAQADRRTATLIPALFHEMFGDPERWRQSSTLGALVQDFRYGTSNKSTIDGKPALRIPNVVGQTVNLDNLKKVPVSDSDFERLRLKDGDLLFVRTNGNADFVGRSAVFDAQTITDAGLNPDEFIYASYLIRARLQVGRVLPVFVQTFLSTPVGRRALRARSKTSAGQFNINTEGLGTIPVPLPPLPLQQEFAQRVAEIRELEAGQAAARLRLEALFQSMLHRAFNGEL